MAKTVLGTLMGHGGVASNEVLAMNNAIQQGMNQLAVDCAVRAMEEMAEVIDIVLGAEPRKFAVRSVILGTGGTATYAAPHWREGEEMQPKEALKQAAKKTTKKTTTSKAKEQSNE